MKSFDLSGYLKDLEYLVNIDSGSYNPEGTAKIADFFNRKFIDLGWQVKYHNLDGAIGPCLEITNCSNNDYDMLFLGHMDTVFKAGTAAERPFSKKEGKIHGPGVADMKSGLLYIYYALAHLQAEGALNNKAICVALNSDEEISSKFSRAWLESLAIKSKNALVLEPARANGNLVNQRKGVGRYKVEVTGKAAHSGVDHEKGCSAIQEIAHWILALHNQTNYQIGTTVNVGVISGGTAANVVADYAAAEVDFRFSSISEAEALEKLIKDLVQKPKTIGVTSMVSGGITRPPMLPSNKTLQLCSTVTVLASDLGITFEWAKTGGGSDGNFTANLGVPTLDALGPIGGGAHGPEEYIQVDSIEPRFTLLCRIIKYLAESEKSIDKDR